MDYYVGNGIYDFLMECDNRDHFYWTSGNLWMLVYGDDKQNPCVLTVASGSELGSPVSEYEKRAVQVGKQMVSGSDIPLNFIRFNPSHPIQSVQYWEYTNTPMKKLEDLSSDGLKKRMSEYGLRINSMIAHKSINDRSSSPYHDWQRTHLGSSVTVADIDLIRFVDERPKEIIELKRSYIELEKWEPYRKDYSNFVLISKLAEQLSLDFYIVYNRRTKTPFFDDVSRLKVFEFDHRMKEYCRLMGYKTINQFANEKET